MAQITFALLNGQQITNAVVTGNGTFDLYTSAAQNNTVNMPCLRLVVDYHASVPDDITIPGGISVVVESQNNGNWFPIAYQFEAYRRADNGPKRIIVLQPDISTFDAGIDDIMWIGDTTAARISRQQGKVGATYRVRVQLKEIAHGQPNQFQSVTMSIYGELYDI